MIQSRGERLFHGVTVLALVLLLVVTIFPILYVLSVSVTPMETLARYGGFQVIPRAITFDAYRYILGSSLIPRAFLNSVFITGVGTALGLIATILMAYPLSRKQMPGRNFLLLLVLLPMLFQGGLIPSYILIKNLGLIDSLWAVILPWVVTTYNLLVMKSFFQSLPEELFEAARIDGASEWSVLWRIVIPLSTPVIATVGLFYAVRHWNGFFDAMMYLNDPNLQPLPVVLRNVLIDVIRGTDLGPEGMSALPGETTKMATVVISIIPMLVIYPWIQKYFTKGLLLGSIKG